MLLSERWVGFIFWGPPGTGKTTLAHVIAESTYRRFEHHSAVTSGVKEFREVLERSRKEIRSGGKATILFIDEIHRLNKGQQDILLPYLEEGAIRFIGATTENPSFEVNNAICSRCVIFHFAPLSEGEILEILKKVHEDYPQVDERVLKEISKVCSGDARRALTLLEHLALAAQPGMIVSTDDFNMLCQSQSIYYDKSAEAHYDTISAFIKSVRGSDPDAALYYLARMLEGGEDPLFIARRLVILASEDIGNANPFGIVLAVNAFTAVHTVGMPEARIILAQATTYLACSEKSNRSFTAVEEAIKCVKETGALEIPLFLRNAVTQLMKNWGYGEGYRYAHDFEKAWVPMQYLPDSLCHRKFYQPSDRGCEKGFGEFLKQRRRVALDENSKSSTPK